MFSFGTSSAQYLFEWSIFLFEWYPICNFADDAAAFACSHNLAEVVKKLEENSNLAITGRG